MKRHLILATAALLLLSTPLPARPAAEGVDTEMKALVEKIQAKLKGEKKTEADLADEIKEFDAILAKHKDEKTDEVAQVLYMKAMLYLQVFDNTEKGIQLIEELKKAFPDSKSGKNADDIIKSIKQQEESKKVQQALVEGSKFPDFEEKDLAGNPLSIAKYKGKVLLVDFWATWCGPCVAELPNVLRAYEKHHKEGFDIVGISLDKEEQKLKDFIKARNMPWAQYFDGKGWQSKLGGKYGVNSIPMTYLLDGEGKIIGKNLRGEALEKAVATALAKTVAN
jgi:thiol-disulfide isomerase/thioredoxin